MTRHAPTMALLALLLLSPPGEAHEQSLHKGKSVEGEVAALAADRLTQCQSVAACTSVVLPGYSTTS